MTEGGLLLGFGQRQARRLFIEVRQRFIVSGFAIVLQVCQELPLFFLELAGFDQHQAEQRQQAPVGLRLVPFRQQRGLRRVKRRIIRPRHHVIPFALLFLLPSSPT